MSSEAQRQTEAAFGFKWAKRDTYESEAMQNIARTWLFERYCGGDPTVLAHWLSGGRKRILDAGCGADQHGVRARSKRDGERNCRGSGDGSEIGSHGATFGLLTCPIKSIAGGHAINPSKQP